MAAAVGRCRPAWAGAFACGPSASVIEALVPSERLSSLHPPRASLALSSSCRCESCSGLRVEGGVLSRLVEIANWQPASAGIVIATDPAARACCFTKTFAGSRTGGTMEAGQRRPRTQRGPAGAARQQRRRDLVGGGVGEGDRSWMQALERAGAAWLANRCMKTMDPEDRAAVHDSARDVMESRGALGVSGMAIGVHGHGGACRPQSLGAFPPRTFPSKDRLGQGSIVRGLPPTATSGWVDSLVAAKTLRFELNPTFVRRHWPAPVVIGPAFCTGRLARAVRCLNGDLPRLNAWRSPDHRRSSPPRSPATAPPIRSPGRGRSIASAPIGDSLLSLELFNLQTINSSARRGMSCRGLWPRRSASPVQRALHLNFA